MIPDYAKPPWLCCMLGCKENATDTKNVLAKRYVDGHPTGLYIVAAPVCLKHR